MAAGNEKIKLKIKQFFLKVNKQMFYYEMEKELHETIMFVVQQSDELLF
jgi:hypothetical protein